MMVQPSEENIKRLIEVTDADRHTAYSFLKVCECSHSGASSDASATKSTLSMAADDYRETVTMWNRLWMLSSPILTLKDMM